MEIMDLMYLFNLFTASKIIDIGSFQLAFLSLDMDILSSYVFMVVCAGTMILAAAAGAIGTISVLKGQSLIGDAIGHSAYPGVVIAFMIGMALDPLKLFIGAIISGAIAFALIQLISRHSKLNLDATLAIILSSFFGLGMVLKSYIQGHEAFAHVSQGGLKNYIFGQAAYIKNADVYLILAVAIPSILIFIIFYKEFKVFIFDETYAKSIGIKSNFMYALMLVITMGLIATGLKVVGAILISSFLIVPAITAMQWAQQFNRVILIASLTGMFSAFLGTYISSIYPGMSTGPSIILVMSLIAFLSMLIGPRGILAKYFRRRKFINDKSNV